jgi:RimJ/RimL family protein N-acetyltransferase
MLIAHADQLFELFQDPELYPFISRTVPTDLSEFRKGIEFLEGRTSYDGKESWLNWVSFAYDTGEIVGKVEITIEKDTGIANLAYTTFRKHWGQGYAKEACAEVIRHLFDHWNATQVVIEIDVRNTASVRLAESLGARRVAFKPKAQMLKEEWSDEYRYELDRGGNKRDRLLISKNDFVQGGGGIKELLKEFLKTIAEGRRVEAMSWLKSEDEEWHQTLIELGFKVHIEKPYFRRKLEDFAFSFNDRFTYRSLRQLGKAQFVEFLALVCKGSPNRDFDRAHPERDLASYQEAAGELFDPDSWFAAFQEDQFIGVVLPQRYPDTPWDGTLMCIGVTQESRGKGVGKLLHAKGLSILKSQGATDYVGSTDILNQPMISVFLANGCHHTAVRRFYRQ